MSTSPVRAAMVPVTRGTRAYFAPLNRQMGAPTIFDPAQCGIFPLDAPPSPWIDLGWIDNFRRPCRTKNEFVSAGPRRAPALQFQGTLDARVEFEFRQWGKLQMALAGGSEHMNVLAEDHNADAQPSGGTPVFPAAVLPGSTALQIVLGTGAVEAFSIGDVVAVDQDYEQQVGYVGTGIAAAYVNDPLDVKRDANYIRRVTFNVGRVAQKTTDSLVLAQPLLGGLPPSNAGVQKVIAFVDREGGSFRQDWSALFVAQDESGGRVCFYYPRLSPTAADGSTGVSSSAFQREDEIEIVKPFAALALYARFLAMPHIDENDGQTVLCYRSYFPAAMAAVY